MYVATCVLTVFLQGKNGVSPVVKHQNKACKACFFCKSLVFCSSCRNVHKVAQNLPVGDHMKEFLKKHGPPRVQDPK